MRRNTILIILGGALLIGVLAWAAYFRGGTPMPAGASAEEKRIMREIDKANHCEAAADCAQAAASVCPFGCYVHVHKDEVTRIQSMLVDFQKTPRQEQCTYSCIEYPGVDCVKGRCVTRGE